MLIFSYQYALVDSEPYGVVWIRRSAVVCTQAAGVKPCLR